MTSRREFIESAVAIGGMAALNACVGFSEQMETPEEQSFPQGATDVSNLPDRQHAWGQYIVRNARQNPVFPQYQVVVFLDYTGSIPPTNAEREQVETSFRTLERAYQWGTGGNDGVAINNGLLFTVAYGPAYFDRFDQSLPTEIDVPPPDSTLEKLDSDPSKANSSAAALHFGSDHPEIVLATEEALFGNLNRINGLDVEATLNDVFEKTARRAGVIGRGVVHTELEHDKIPKRSPLSMGFKSAFHDTLPSEDRITISTGPFTDGTTEHFSRVEIDLDKWYDIDQEGRVKRMFGVDYTVEEVGEAGDALGSTSRINEERAASSKRDAETKGIVGHTQKTARARDEDFVPRILRRGEFLSPPTSKERGAVLNFGSLQKGIADFVETRKAMQHVDYGHDDGTNSTNIDTDNDGILGHIEVTDRANFLLPPRHLRALPPARPHDR